MAGVPAAVKALAMLLMLTGFVLALAALVAFVRGVVLRLPGGGGAQRGAAQSADRMTPKGAGELSFRADRILFASAYLVHFLLYLKFSYDNPYMCSMDFRYIRILLLFPAVALGVSVNRAKGNPLRVRALWMLLVLFSVFSAAITFAWCFL